MASLRNVFRPTQGAWSAGQPYDNETDIYLDGARWSNPASIVGLTPGSPVFAARLGPGQILGLEIGGVHAAKPPAETPEE